MIGTAMIRIGRVSLALALAATFVESGKANTHADTSCYQVYVVSQRSDSLTFLDCQGHRLGRAAVGRNPHEVMVNAQAGLAYTSDYLGGTISVVGLAERRRLRTVVVYGNPHGLALSPNHRLLFVTLEGQHEVTALQLPGLSVVARLSVGEGPHMLYPTPDRRAAKVARSLPMAGRPMCWIAGPVT
jgi:DNA-binding beta-propeller fold protein YncE